jgi:hypothetical protein
MPVSPPITQGGPLATPGPPQDQPQFQRLPDQLDRIAHR